MNSFWDTTAGKNVKSALISVTALAAGTLIGWAGLGAFITDAQVLAISTSAVTALCGFLAHLATKYLPKI